MTATEYDFSVTRTQILERAFRQIGALSLGETMSSDQEVQGNLVLNTIVKSWQSLRTFLWTTSTFTEPLTAAIGTYPLPTSPSFVSIDRGYLRDTSSYDTEIKKISLQEFYSIPDKTSQGTPTYYSTDLTSLFLWPIPLTSSTWSFFGVGISKLKDWDTAGATGEFPAKWINALVYSVAYDLSTEYGIPINERMMLKQSAQEAFQMARNGTEELSNNCYTRGAFG
jgi:hypothetical protein